MDERTARMALTCVTEPAMASIAQAVTDYGAESVWAAVTEGGGPVSQRALRCDVEAVRRRAEEEGLRFVIPGDEEWPARLDDLSHSEPVNGMSGAPIGLWLKGGGHLGELMAQSVSMVGSRASTAYGESVAADMAADLGNAGVCVVSGGAYGIDAAAHRGCLASRTATVAVLASGLDQPYPQSHHHLFERVGERGLLVSEFPPGEHPTRVRFLGRNRLIAALTPGTVVVEAGVRSGARNTMTWVASLNRIAMAVPGPVTSATSFTPHQMIRDAEAVLVASAGDVRELLGPFGHFSPRPQGQRRVTDDMTPAELAVYEAISARRGLAADEIALKSGVPVPQTLGILNRLADQDLIVQNPRLEWILAPRRRPDSVADTVDAPY